MFLCQVFGEDGSSVNRHFAAVPRIGEEIEISSDTSVQSVVRRVRHISLFVREFDSEMPRVQLWVENANASRT